MSIDYVEHECAWCSMWRSENSMVSIGAYEWACRDGCAERILACLDSDDTIVRHTEEQLRIARDRELATEIVRAQCDECFDHGTVWRGGMLVPCPSPLHDDEVA